VWAETFTAAAAADRGIYAAAAADRGIYAAAAAILTEYSNPIIF
jgi:hypothetical protein